MHHRATTALILANVFMAAFVWLVVDPSYVAEHLAFSTSNLLHGKLHTLLTSLFVHASLVHLIGNLLFLAFFAIFVENQLGAGRMLTVYLTGGAGALVLGTLLYPRDALLVGSSGAIFTLIAVTMLVKPLDWLSIPVGLLAVAFFVFNLVAIFLRVGGPIAYPTHVLGFLLGLPYGIRWGEAWRTNLLVSSGSFVLFMLAVALTIPLAR